MATAHRLRRACAHQARAAHRSHPFIWNGAGHQPSFDVVSGHAAAAGLAGNETAALILAVNEVATNSVRHGGGHRRLRVWQEGDNLVCEIRDQGHINRRLVGRERPAADQEAGRGLWLVNQLCDLVQIRTSPAGTVVRLHMRRSR